MSELRFDRTMSDAEGLMWRLEKDPHLSSTFANVTLLDRAPDMAMFRRRMDRATQVVPRLRQRVQPSPANLTPPTWVEDTEFDLDHHLRRVALPKPAGLRDLLDLAALIVADPFDRTRPLWQFVVVEGLRGGKAALIEKLHHTITDGERGVELSLQFLDFERDAPEPPPVHPASGTGADDDGDGPTSGPGDPSAADALRDVVVGGLRLPIGVARQVRELLADPASLPAAGAAAGATFRGLLSQLADVDGARSPLWTQRSLKRRIETARAPFRETRDAARRLGGTLNTAFLTIAAEAASRYHEELDSPVDALRASMAVSTRTEASGGNAFSLVRMLVPTDPMPIAERFAAIGEATVAAQERTRGAGVDTVAALATGLPTSLVTRLARQQAQTVDFATSNVRGAPMPMYLAGAQLLENYPVGPLGGVAFNVTLLSYDGSLDMGINIDAAAVAEPERLVRAVRRASKQLLTA